jgi:hypothetical protein
MKKAGSLTGSPSGEPLAIIQEEGELDKQTSTLPTTTPFQADFASGLFIKIIHYLILLIFSFSKKHLIH